MNNTSNFNFNIYDSMSITVGVIACIITYYVWWRKDIKSSARDMLEHFYFPLYLLLHHEIESPMKVSCADIERYKTGINKIIKESHGFYPNSFLSDIEMLTPDNFHKFCRLVKESYQKCQQRAGYVSISTSNLKNYDKYYWVSRIIVAVMIPLIIAFYITTIMQRYTAMIYIFLILVGLMSLLVVLPRIFR